MPPSKCERKSVPTMNTKMSSKTVQKVKTSAGTLLALVALVAMASILIPYEVERIRANPSPNTGRLTDRPAVAISDITGEEVAGIDWAFWQSMNPDIVGWITIPGTPIDYPLVQASPQDPTFYLDHDAYRDYNYYGCPYVDASCGVESGNVLIFAHNMGGIDNSMFTALPSYLSPQYLAEHPQVIIQTPEGVRELEVRAAENVSPYGYTKHTTFSSTEALREFYLDLWKRASSRSTEPAAAEIAQLFTLITCDERGAARTLVYVG